MILFAAFIAGLFGSIHCIGMCGGFVGLFNQSSAETHPDRSASYSLGNWLLTNLGRLSSYALAGALAGFLGGAAVGLFDPAHVRNIGLMLSGGFMVALGLYLAGWWQGLSAIERLGGGLWKHIQPTLSRMLTQRGWRKSLMVGLIWGWLPCGLVYSMLAWSMSIATPLGGASIMLAFGLGTLPMLIGLAELTNKLQTLRRNKTLRQFLGAIIICFGLLTLLGLVRPFHVPMFSNPVMCEAPMPT